MTKLRCMLCCLMICTITIDARTVNDIYKRISAQVSLKVPGNQSRNYSLAFQGAVDDKGIYLLESEEKIPLIITERIERDNVKCVMVVSITALEDVYFNYQQQLKTGFRHNDCMFIYQDSGIVAIYVLLKVLLHFIYQRVGWYVRIV